MKILISGRLLQRDTLSGQPEQQRDADDKQCNADQLGNRQRSTQLSVFILTDEFQDKSVDRVER